MTPLALPEYALACQCCGGPIEAYTGENCPTCERTSDLLFIAEADLRKMAVAALLPFIGEWVKRHPQLPYAELRCACGFTFDGLVQEGADAALRVAFDAAWFEAQTPAPSAAH